MRRPTPITPLGDAIHGAASELRAVLNGEYNKHPSVEKDNAVARAEQHAAKAYRIYTREVQIVSIALSESGGFMLATDILGRLWIGQKGDTVEWRRINNPQEPGHEG